MKGQTKNKIVLGAIGAILGTGAGLGTAWLMNRDRIDRLINAYSGASFKYADSWDARESSKDDTERQNFDEQIKKCEKTMKKAKRKLHDDYGIEVTSSYRDGVNITTEF